MKEDLNLDQSVSKFEQGMKLSKMCNDILESAEKRISILIKKDDEVTEENFNVEQKGYYKTERGKYGGYNRKINGIFNR